MTTLRPTTTQTGLCETDMKVNRAQNSTSYVQLVLTIVNIVGVSFCVSLHLRNRLPLELYGLQCLHLACNGTSRIDMSNAYIGESIMNTRALARPSSLVRLLVSSSIVCLMTTTASAEPISAGVQQKVDQAHKKLEAWAVDATVIAAVKTANGSQQTMTNGKWDALGDTDPLVLAMQTNAAGKLLVGWAKTSSTLINKLYLRDVTANFIAGTDKPVRYNNSRAPQFASCLTGSAWSDKEVNPDPATSVKSVQLCVPVKEGGKVIGVLHTAVTAL